VLLDPLQMQSHPQHLHPGSFYRQFRTPGSRREKWEIRADRYETSYGLNKMGSLRGISSGALRALNALLEHSIHLITHAPPVNRIEKLDARYGIRRQEIRRNGSTRMSYTRVAGFQEAMMSNQEQQVESFLSLYLLIRYMSTKPHSE